MLLLLQIFQYVLDGPLRCFICCDDWQKQFLFIIFFHQLTLILFNHHFIMLKCQIYLLYKFYNLHFSINIIVMIRLQELAKIFPQLSYQSVKGKNGIIGVIGGSFQYTGAPFYTAMTALKMGADLAHVFCSKLAAGPIKSYSPQLIVHPVFQDNFQKISSQQIKQMVGNCIQYFKTKIGKINSWVIGPGLGRGVFHEHFFPQFIKVLPQKSNIVIDADGLYFLCKHNNLMKNLQKLNCILTPNHTQFKYLNKFMEIEEDHLKIGNLQQKLEQNVVGRDQAMKKQLPVTVIIKGQKDIILHRDRKRTVVLTKGGKKRCGGIGDVLAGCVACCALWDFQKGPILACHVAKIAASKGYEVHGRSLTGLGVLQQIEGAIKTIQK